MQDVVFKITVGGKFQSLPYRGKSVSPLGVILQRIPLKNNNSKIGLKSEFHFCLSSFWRRHERHLDNRRLFTATSFTPVLWQKWKKQKVEI